MKFLSKYRRNKFAKPLLLMFALLTLGFTYSVATAAPASNSMSASAKTTLIEEGQTIFLKGCSSCHGLNSEGGAVAPSLIGVGAASVDFQVGTGRMPMQDMSQQAMRKAPLYDEEEVAEETVTLRYHDGKQVQGLTKEQLLNLVQSVS
jgi:ubiquinol-cytochrome c reductase cytochrome c subunit